MGTTLSSAKAPRQEVGSSRASSTREAFAGLVIATVGKLARSYEALLLQLVRVDRTLTRALLNKALDDLRQEGRIEIEVQDKGITIHPIKKIPAGKRAGSSKKEAAR